MCVNCSTTSRYPGSRILTSLQSRSARGSAAETAARPPTRTKSSISVVTNKTLKKRPLSRPLAETMQERFQLLYGSNAGQHSRPPTGYVTDARGGRFLGVAVQFRVTPRQDAGPMGAWND